MGAAAGTIIGILVAPRSGAETRAMAADMANDAWDSARDMYEQGVDQARTAATTAATPEEKMAADNTLTGALRQLLMVAEAYPDLKANANFTQLQASLEDTENKISYARQSYNDCVLNYNNGIQTFPGNIFAGIFQFKQRSGFEAAEASREVPQVKF